MSNQEYIKIGGAYENNLKHISLDILKKQITIFTGISDSGRSSLVLDTIAASSRRELNKTFPSFVQQYLPKYGRPHVDRIGNLSVAIMINQRKPTPNARSTVGTYMDIYSLLRLLSSRVGKPFVGYSDTLFFNHPQGRCTRRDGLGEIRELDVHKLVDFDKCLNDEDMIRYVTFQPGQWRWIRYACSGLFDLDKKIRDYTPGGLRLFLYSPQIRLKNPPADWPKTAKYESLITRTYRGIINSKEGKIHQKISEPTVTMGTCPDCGGTRLNDKVFSCRISGRDIAEVTHMAIPEIIAWLREIDDLLAKDMKQAIGDRLSALLETGLGYLTLDHSMETLSGGGAQRYKIAKHINSSLSDTLYVLGKPSVGLHNHNIHSLKASARKLRGRGNTVLLMGHHKEMIQITDHIVDMGPGSGTEGGRTLYEGDYAGLPRSDTLTGRMLEENTPLKESLRIPSGWFTVKHARLHNLKDVTVDFPMGVLAVIVGVAGSGKSSLMECLHRDFLEEVIYTSQKNIGISLRSTPATYLEVADDIRKLFAKESKAGLSMFTLNGKGSCPACGRKDVIVSGMAFMDSIEIVCEACGGLRYSPEALRYIVDGLTIVEVMDLTVRKASLRFAGTVIAEKLRPLMLAGLGHLHLNQTLSTLSGGELQRVKLASYLRTQSKVFVLDEPTDDLHVKDIRHIISLFDSMVDQGNSVFLIEHDLNVLKVADYVIEIDPGGGLMGGEILFSGTPKELLPRERSAMKDYLVW